MVAQVLRSCSSGLNTDNVYCVVFSGKTLCSHHQCVQMDTAELNGGNLALVSHDSSSPYATEPSKGSGVM